MLFQPRNDAIVMKQVPAGWHEEHFLVDHDIFEAHGALDEVCLGGGCWWRQMRHDDPATKADNALVAVEEAAVRASRSRRLGQRSEPDCDRLAALQARRRLRHRRLGVFCAPLLELLLPRRLARMFKIEAASEQAEHEHDKSREQRERDRRNVQWPPRIDGLALQFLNALLVIALLDHRVKIARQALAVAWQLAAGHFARRRLRAQRR